jgi:hypothetical protein
MQGHFQLERSYNGESATENALRKGDNFNQASLIRIKRPTLCKLLFNSRYTTPTIQYLYYSLDTV